MGHQEFGVSVGATRLAGEVARMSRVDVETEASGRRPARPVYFGHWAACCARSISLRREDHFLLGGIRHLLND